MERVCVATSTYTSTMTERTLHGEYGEARAIERKIYKIFVKESVRSMF